MTVDPVVRPYYSSGGLNLETYDARIGTHHGATDGDVAWYLRHARACGGPVLELACGTGRVAWALADAGIAVVGLDLNPDMLALAEEKRSARPPEVSRRLRLVRGDMTDFALSETFPLVIVPFRAFQSLLTVEAQRRALGAIRRHLQPGGRLHLHLFDPRLHWIAPRDGAPPIAALPAVRSPRTGLPVEVAILDRINDPVTQVLRERWRFTERSGSGTVLRQEDELLELRWSFRYEMHHLLELAGYEIEAECSDFTGAPPAYGREQIWIARRPDAGSEHRGRATLPPIVP